MRHRITIDYDEYDSAEELVAADRELMQKAMSATEGAYAPYSHFRVGAALLMANGIVVTGSNQENIAYPSGLCAERTAIFAAAAKYPQERDYLALAIVGRNAGGQFCEASPCGACRQVLMEYENNQKHPLRVLCYRDGGGVRVYEKVADLLPFAFDF